MARMGKKLAEMFCDFVAGPGAPSSYREFNEWAVMSCSYPGTAFWQELALWVRDCGHKHSMYALFRLAATLASELSKDKRFIGKIAQTWEECAERFNVRATDEVNA